MSRVKNVTYGERTSLPKICCKRTVGRVGQQYLRHQYRREHTTMSLTLPPECQALETALTALQKAVTPAEKVPLARTVTRLADDLSLVAAETCTEGKRKQLGIQIATARCAASEARAHARSHALSNREELLRRDVDTGRGQEEQSAARVAADINAGLRRAMGVIEGEVERSRAAGGVVRESTRKLRAVREVHGGVKQSVRAGGGVLKRAARKERLADLVVVTCVMVFFVVAAMIVRRRVAGSAVGSVVGSVVGKGGRVVMAPIKAASRVLMRGKKGVAEVAQEGKIEGGEESREKCDGGGREEDGIKEEDGVKLCKIAS